MPTHKKHPGVLAGQAKQAVAQQIANVRIKIRSLPADADAADYYDVLDRLNEALENISKCELAEINKQIDPALLTALETSAEAAHEEAEKLKEIAGDIAAYAKAADAAAGAAKAILKIAALA